MIIGRYNSFITSSCKQLGPSSFTYTAQGHTGSGQTCEDAVAAWKRVSPPKPVYSGGGGTSAGGGAGRNDPPTGGGLAGAIGALMGKKTSGAPAGSAGAVASNSRISGGNVSSTTGSGGGGSGNILDTILSHDPNQPISNSTMLLVGAGALVLVLLLIR